MGFNVLAFGAASGAIEGVAGGLKSTKQNADGSVTVTYTDGKSYTTPIIKGKDGEDGHTPTYTEIKAIVDEVVNDEITEALNGRY